MNYHDEAQNAIDPIIDFAVKIDYRRRLCQIYTVLGSNYLFMENDCLKALKVLEEALKLAAEVKDAVTEIFASYWYGIALSMNGEFERSLPYIQKALDINVAFNIPWGIAAIKSDLSHLNYFYSGKIDMAYRTSQEAVRIADESGDIMAKAFAYPFHGFAFFGKGYLEEAEKNLLKALEVTEKVNHHLRNGGTYFWLALTYSDKGNFRKAKVHLERGIRIFEDIHLWPSSVCLGKVSLTRLKVLNKEKGADLETLYDYVKNTKLKYFQGEVRKFIAEILLNIDNLHLSEAEHWIQEAIDKDRANGIDFSLAQDHVVYADLSKRKGDKFMAKENLIKAMEIFTACGADGWVTRTERELASLA